MLVYSTLAMVHPHCDKCFTLTRCSAGTDGMESCAIISCHLGCGSHFHACKLAEHKLLCKNEEVSCINVAYGCPRKLPRYRQAIHLKTCPASGVICTVEWNRYSCTSGKTSTDCSTSRCITRKGELDIALVLSDERKLNTSVKVSDDLHRTLCSDVSCSSCAADLAKKLDLVQNGIEITDFKLEENNIILSDKLHSLSDSVLQKEYINIDVLHTSDYVLNSSDSYLSENKNFTNTVNIDSYASLNVCEYKYLNTDSVLRNDTDGDISEREGTDTEFINQVADNDNSIVFFEVKMKDIFLNSAKDNVPIQPPPSTPGTNRIVLNMTLESITKYQNKHKNMHTFLCGKVFRRDEYAWHYKNVHCDIHGSLNGWLEQRCPLAVYGCSYSQRRFYPTKKGASVIHNELLESFGIKLNEVCTLSFENKSDVINGDIESKSVINHVHNIYKLKSQQSEKQLIHLPYEVLRHILRFLDSFSLCNMALTCQYFRNVCCSLLLERGIVLQKWKKTVVDNKTLWFVESHHWLFSTGFSPVKIWGFEDHSHMSEHLKNCPYYERNVPTTPFQIFK